MFTFSDFTTIPISGAMRQLSVYNNEMWGIGQDFSIYKTTLSTTGISGWITVTNTGNYIWVSIGPSQVWALQSDNRVFTCNSPCNGAWAIVYGLNTQISLGTNVAWGTTSSGAIWSSKVPFDNWVLMDGNANSISVSMSYVLTSTTSGELHRCPLPCSPGTTSQIVPGTAIQMGGSIQDDTIYASGTDKIPYKYDGNKWIIVGNFQAAYIFSLNAKEFIACTPTFGIIYSRCQ